MKYKNIFGMAISALALGATVAACTDANDWETDPTYNRLFGVNASKITIDRDQEAPSTVTVNFNPIQGAEYYIVEVSTDSLYNDVEMGGENAIVFGTNKDITKSPVTLTGLAEETNYYMRIKTMSSTTPESHWAYYNSGESFKTLGIIYDVPAADILEDRITLRWIPGSEVTHITYTTKIDEQDVTETRRLKDDEIANSTCTIDGLQSNKTYNFAIYKGEQLRGTKTVKTAKPMPAADLKQELPENTTTIDQDLLDNLAAQALAITGTDKASITIGVPAGKTLVLGDKNEEGEDAGVTIPEGISITFFGMAGEVPTLTVPKEIKIDGNHEYIRFENVNLDAKYEDNKGNEQYGLYVINQGDACYVEDVSFTGVNITNFQRSIVRLQGDEKTLRNLSFDNCIITEQGKNEDYAFVYISGNKYNTETINVTNCTFNTARYLFRISSTTSLKEVNIKNSTFYNTINRSKYLIDADKTTAKITLDKVLLGKTFAAGKGIRPGDSSLLSVTNTYKTNDFELAGNSISDAIDLGLSSSEVFKSPETGDFTINNTELISNQVGDPRWIPAN